MPVGLVVFEISSASWTYARRLPAKLCSEFQLLGTYVRKHFLPKLIRKTRPCNVTVLLICITLYLILSRGGPILSKVGETTFETFDLHGVFLQNLNPVGLQSLKGIYKVFRGVTRVPGPFTHRYRLGASLASCVKSQVMVKKDPEWGGRVS